MARPTLRIGSTGSYVQELQELLKRLGFYSGTISQTFDTATQTSVRAFQSSAKITADGIVGTNTWNAIDAAIASLPELGHPTIRRGDSGSAVSELQELLGLLKYFNGKIDGIFGIGTENAVKAFQNDHGLKSDGVVGPATWASIEDAITNLPPEPNRPTLRLGDAGAYVRELQEMLSLLGFYSGPINGTFDAVTQEAVMAFQRGNGLIADGIVGSTTWDALDYAIEHIPNPMPEERSIIKLGDTGHYVQDLQMMLRLLGYYSGPISSVFDQATKDAAKSFQSAAGLVTDGIIGPVTWGALTDAIERLPAPTVRPTLRPGVNDPAVLELKQMLTQLGFYNGALNTTYDSLLEQAVLSFQKRYGLVADGIVGPLTWSELDDAINTKPPVNPRPDLKEGSTGPAVSELHQMLNYLGYYNSSNSVFPDYFSAETKAMVQAFQRNYNLDPTGIVDQATWQQLDRNVEELATINPILQQGNSGTAVELLQNMMTGLGFYYGPINGYFSQELKNSVVRFQSAYGLAPDGIVGQLTWRAIKQQQVVYNAPEFALVWTQNPSAYTITTDAFLINSPVWYVLNLEPGSNRLYIDPRRGSRAYTDVAHAAGRKVWGTVQSFNADNTRALVTSAANVQKFIADSITLVIAHDLDGLVIDFEYMYVVDKALFSDFVRKLSSALRENASSRQRDFIVAVCFTAPPYPGDNYNMWSASVDREDLSHIADYCCVMLYDEHGPGTVPGPIAGYNWAEDGLVRTIAESVPPYKILLGVPLYSGDWTFSKNSAGNYISDGVTYNLRMDMIQSLMTNGYYTDRSGTVIRVASVTAGPETVDGVLHYAFIDTTGKKHDIYAETADALAKKLGLVAQYQLAGAAAWEYSFGDSSAWAVFNRFFPNQYGSIQR